MALGVRPADQRPFQPAPKPVGWRPRKEPSIIRPDLSTPEGVAAHKAELMGLARPWRYGGLLMVCAATALLLWVRFHDLDAFKTLPGLIGVALMVGGWAMLIRVILARNTYNRRRMAEAP